MTGEERDKLHALVDKLAVGDVITLHTGFEYAVQGKRGLIVIVSNVIDVHPYRIVSVNGMDVDDWMLQ